MTVSVQSLVSVTVSLHYYTPTLRFLLLIIPKKQIVAEILLNISLELHLDWRISKGANDGCDGAGLEVEHHRVLVILRIADFTQ